MSTTPGITLHNITLHTLGSGRGITLKGQGGFTGDFVMTYNELGYGGTGPGEGTFEDMTATTSGFGFTINDSGNSGVAMSGLSVPNLAFCAANLPDSHPGGSGEIWTVTWAAGSTYSTTPVAIYYVSSGFGPYPTVVMWVLNPSDNTYHTGAAGTFNLPATFTAGTTTTNFAE